MLINYARITNKRVNEIDKIDLIQSIVYIL